MWSIARMARQWVEEPWVVRSQLSGTRNECLLLSAFAAIQDVCVCFHLTVVPYVLKQTFIMLQLWICAHLFSKLLECPMTAFRWDTVWVLVVSCRCVQYTKLTCWSLDLFTWQSACGQLTTAAIRRQFWLFCQYSSNIWGKKKTQTQKTQTKDLIIAHNFCWSVCFLLTAFLMKRFRKAL